MRKENEMMMEEMNQVNGGAATQCKVMTVDYNSRNKGYDVYQNDKKVATFYDFEDADNYVSTMMGTTSFNM